ACCLVRVGLLCVRVVRLLVGGLVVRLGIGGVRLPFLVRILFYAGILRRVRLSVLVRVGLPVLVGVGPGRDFVRGFVRGFGRVPVRWPVLRDRRSVLVLWSLWLVWCLRGVFSRFRLLVFQRGSLALLLKQRFDLR